MKCTYCKDECQYKGEDGACLCPDRMECYICHISLCVKCESKGRKILGHYQVNGHIFCQDCYKEGACR